MWQQIYSSMYMFRAIPEFRPYRYCLGSAGIDRYGLGIRGIVGPFRNRTYVIRTYAWRQIESKSSLLFYIHIRKAPLPQILHLLKPSPACSTRLLCIITWTMPWSSMALSCTWTPFLFALVTTVYTLAFTFKGTRDPVEEGCATTWSDFGFSLCHDNGIDWT